MGLKGVLILLALVAALAATAWADQDGKPATGCGATVRLDSPGGTMEHVPVVDQGDLGICFSASASEMKDAYHLSHGGIRRGFRSSMIEGTIGYALSRHKNVHDALDDGGNPCEVVNYYKKKGSCDAKVLSEQGGELRKQFDFLEKSYSYLYPSSGDDDCGQNQQKPSPDVMKKIRGLLANQGCTEEEATDEKLAQTRDQLIDVLRSIATKTEKQALSQLEQACEDSGREPGRFKSCEESDELSPKNADKTRSFVVDYFSSKTVQPLTIGYCDNVLYAGAKYEGLTPNAKGGTDASCDCGLHNSVLIGKRTNPKTGQCQLLIQNSWGTDCSAYSKDWQCENGKAWVDADALLKNIDSYSYLK